MPSQSAQGRRRSSDPFRDSNTGPPSPPKDEMLSAIRDSVTVKSVTDPRAKVGRSLTSNVVSGNTTPPRSRRSASIDSVPTPVEKNSKSRPKASKKASMHADIIDRLDFSGVGAAMLHHDGPFDACAPSRNKHKHKAPMMAWGDNDDPSIHDPITDRRLSPLAQSTLAAMSSYDSPYHSASLYPGSPGSLDSMPKKRVDALAEAWGIAEPEPFEEFHAGGGDRSAASSIKNGKESHSSSRRAKEARDAYRDILDEGRSNRPRVRSNLPPPQPISLPGSRPLHSTVPPPKEDVPNDTDVSSPNLPLPEESPRRSRSIMARIRKMRDAPNVPLTHDEGTEPSDSPPESVDGAASPMPGRRTHKHQHSFLGRFARSPGGGGGGGNSTSPISDSSMSAEFFYVDDGASTREKDLPPPPERDLLGDAVNSPGPRLGRRTSLMKKVVKGVRGRTAKQ